MVSIAPFADLRTFDPETNEILGKAFDAAWTSLAEAGDVLSAPFKASSTRALLARQIVAAAAGGERDPVRLRDHALAALRRDASAQSRA